MTHYIGCPHCDGEKVFEPDREPGQKWHREDGYYLVEKDSCACLLTEEEYEAMQLECDKRDMEPDEP